VIASWDGKLTESVGTPGAPVKNREKTKDGKKPAGNPFQGHTATTGGSNPFADALQGRAPRGGANTSTTFGSLFKPK
jgi:hypothetical protein